MSKGYWLTTLRSEPVSNTKPSWQVRYCTPGLGFAVDAVVDDKTAHMLSVAIEHGKELARAEVRKVLGL